MMNIQRSKAPKVFTDGLKKFMSSNWDDFVQNYHDVYQSTRTVLEEGQMHLSGYTELPLKTKTHIDHFLKKVLFPEHTFDWLNYVVDEHNKDYGADYKDTHIRNRQDNEKLISPINENPQDFFTYQASGEMIARDGISDGEKERADFTIDSFNLNHRFLIKKRSDMLSIIQSYHEGGLGKKEIKDALQAQGLVSYVEFCLNDLLTL